MFLRLYVSALVISLLITINQNSGNGEGYAANVSINVTEG